MAHSFITYRDKSDMFRDADVLLIIGMARHVAKNTTDGRLRSILDKWFLGYDEFPSGAIDLELDTVIADEVLSTSFIALLDAVEKTLWSHGTKISGVWLTAALDDGHGAIYKDAKTSDVLEKVTRFRKLIQDI